MTSHSARGLTRNQCGSASGEAEDGCHFVCVNGVVCISWSGARTALRCGPGSWKCVQNFRFASTCMVQSIFSARLHVSRANSRRPRRIGLESRVGGPAAPPSEKSPNRHRARRSRDRMPADGELHKAANQGELLEVESLLKEDGSKIDARGAQGRTPLHRALGAGFKGVAELLLDNAADVALVDTCKRTCARSHTSTCACVPLFRVVPNKPGA